MKTIAVAGSNGFIGSCLVKALSKKKLSIVKLTRNSNLNSKLRNVDVLINLVGTSASQTFQEHVDANVIYLSNLCLAASKNNVRKIIHISASALYTNTEYGLSKKLGEEVCRFYHQHNGTHFMILRPPSVYGPGAQKGVVNVFANLIKTTGTVTIFGDGSQKRDFMYIDDLLSAIIKSVSYQAEFEQFNVGSGKVYSLLELVSTFEKVTGKKIKVDFIKDKTNSAHQVSSNINSTKRLGWQPLCSLEAGLKKVILG